MTKAEWVVGKMEERGSDTSGLQIYECLFHPGEYCLGHEPVKFAPIIEEQVRTREIYRLLARLESVILKKQRWGENHVSFEKVPVGKRQKRRERRKKAREQASQVTYTYADYVAKV